jgi:predicted Zn-dependent protease
MATGVAVSDEDGRGQRAAMVAAMVNQMVQLKYSRGDELEADRVGMDYMSQAGYDPAAMLGVMRILAEASQGGAAPELLRRTRTPSNAWSDPELPRGTVK